MKRMLCLFLTLILLETAGLAETLYIDNRETDKVYPERLNLRAEPSKNGAILGLYYTGAEVESLGAENESYTRVRIGGVNGYMATEYLVTLEEAERRYGADSGFTDCRSAEIELAGMERREHVLAEALAGAGDDYDYIFIDCPPSLGLITLNALCASQGVLIPIQCEYYALEGVSALMGTIQKVQRINRRLNIEGVVLTMLDARTNLGLQVAKEVRKVFKGKVYSTVIPRNVRLGEAPSHGTPIHLYDPRSLGAQSYQALAREFLAR